MSDTIHCSGYFQAESIPIVGSGNTNANLFAWDEVNWTLNEDGTGGNVDIDWTAITQFSIHIDSTLFQNGTDTQFAFI